MQKPPPRIYYLHPLLAGPLPTWTRHFERCGGLGFDHVLMAPPFLPGRGGNIFAVADHDVCHPALESSVSADEALATIVTMGREHGISVLLDLALDRFAIDSPLVRRAADWFPSASDPNAVPPDPRLRQEDRFSVIPRPGAWTTRDGLTGWWHERLRRWLDAGIGGFRCVAPHLGPPPPVLADLMQEARRHRPDTVFIAWTPGLARQDLAALAACPFDRTVASTAWWDYRADWLWSEDEALRAIAPPLGLPEAPFGPRLAEGCTDPTLLARRYRRASLFAAAWGDGWIVPMGFEFAATRRLDPARDKAGDFDNLSAAPILDCAGDIIAANELCRSAAPTASRGHRRVSAPDAAIAASYLVPREGNPDSGRLVLANAELASASRIDAACLLARTGGPLATYRTFVPDDGSTVGPDSVIGLAPGEVRLLSVDNRPPASPRRRPARITAEKAVGAPRIGIEQISPAVDDGRFPVKRLVGDAVTVEADIICDGHGILAAAVLWRHGEETAWREQRMELLGNDRWRAVFPLERLGRYAFTVESWFDVFATYRDELTKKYAAGRTVDLEIQEGRQLVAAAAGRTAGTLATALAEIVETLPGQSVAEQVALLLAESTAHLMARADARPFAYRRDPPLLVEADRRAAQFASWYEVFPRSQSGDVARHGTFDDVIRNLPRIQAMGFDVLYFPPIHPIGRTNRKGRNNTLTPAPDDPGSPYAIGAAEGGHDAIHPALGTIDDFRRLRREAESRGIELALDFAIQCAPDHPWLKQHPEWFDWRPDGSLRYAENPPKKYEDIVNVDFYAAGARPSLWLALRDVVLFWAAEGVRIFRVDNPHTKPLAFWEWMIADVRSRYPDTLFLSEAFTRPKVMYRLAKIGFSQSYTYFTWRNTKQELQAYVTELSTTAPRDFFRPHFFVNTPDINPLFLQTSGRAGFLIRAALAATLSGLWGLYNGFELCEATPVPGREEYANSEKYELRAWDWDRPGNIVAEVTRLNQIRRQNPALESHLGVTFYNAFNDNILYYGKATANRDNTILVAVNLDPHHAQEADFEVPLWEWGLPDHGTVVVEDLMRGERTTWTGKIQRLRLDPGVMPFSIWRVAPQRSL